MNDDGTVELGINVLFLGFSIEGYCLNHLNWGILGCVLEFSVSIHIFFIGDF